MSSTSIRCIEKGYEPFPLSKIDSDRTTNVDSLYGLESDSDYEDTPKDNIFVTSIKTIESGVRTADEKLVKFGKFGTSTSRADKVHDT